MADQKISQLPTITGANMADNDKFVLVDTSGDATVATTRAEFFKNTPDIDVTGKLSVADSGTAIPTTGYGTGMMVTRTDGLMGTMFGFQNSPQAGYLQVANFTNTGNLPFLINPRGGIVGVGTNAPSAFGGQIVSYQSGGASSSAVACVNSATTGTARQIDFFRGASTSRIGSIESTPTSVSYNTSSDYRLKTDAQPMTGASERVQELNPVNFEWISGGSRVDGFLAHEAQEVVPEAVSGERDAMRDEEYEVTPAVLDDDGNVTTEAVMDTHSVPDYQGIDQSKLVPLLTAALQEALTEISSLKSRVEVLEG